MHTRYIKAAGQRIVINTRRILPSLTFSLVSLNRVVEHCTGFGVYVSRVHVEAHPGWEYARTGHSSLSA